MVRVKIPRPLMQCVHDQGANAGVRGDRLCAKYSVPKQGDTELYALGLAIDSQAGQHHDRHRIRHVPANRAGRFLMRDRAGRQGVVTEHALLIVGNDKSPGGSASLVGQCPPREPIVQGGFTAAELLEPVRFGESLRRREGEAHRQGALTPIKRSRPGFSLGGASSMAVNSRNLWSSS